MHRNIKTGNKLEELQQSERSHLKLPQNSGDIFPKGERKVNFKNSKRPCNDDESNISSERQFDEKTTSIETPQIKTENYEDLEIFRAKEVTKVIQVEEENSEDKLLIEKLADMIIDGEGASVSSYQSDDPIVKVFVQRTPSYMKKIELLRDCCINGDLTRLQLLLDRRKFARAKENVTPFRLSLTHIAVLFNRFDIVSFLSKKFPETLSVTDTKGRMVLHYAAGLQLHRIYTLLVELGADIHALDKDGKDPQFYLRNKNYLSFFENIKKEVTRDESDQSLQNSTSDGSDNVFTESENNTPIATERGRKEAVTFIEENENDEIISSLDILKESRELLEDLMDETNENIGQGFNKVNRDEYGQTMLHLSAYREHNRNKYLELLHHLNLNVGYRDEMLRTARDVAVVSEVYANIIAIDKYVLHLACRGEARKLFQLMMEGYDHIFNTENTDDIMDISEERGHLKTNMLLHIITPFQVSRDHLHRIIREGHLDEVDNVMKMHENHIRHLLVIGKNTSSRCSMHICILLQHIHLVEYFAKNYPETLSVGDNLERTALHYAMGVPEVDSLTAILIHAGAKKNAKDLKGRWPSYYYMDKSEIQKLQNDEVKLKKDISGRKLGSEELIQSFNPKLEKNFASY